MSKLSSLVLGVVGGAAMFGAIQYASGNDLRGTLTDRDTAITAPVATTVVNRSGKSDRSMMVARLDQGQTLSFHVQGLTDTSVLLRLAGPTPKAEPAKPETSKATPVQSAAQKSPVACEPPVSMLTDIARTLQPGRCVT